MEKKVQADGSETHVRKKCTSEQSHTSTRTHLHTNIKNNKHAKRILTLKLIYKTLTYTHTHTRIQTLTNKPNYTQMYKNTRMDRHSYRQSQRQTFF